MPSDLEWREYATNIESENDRLREQVAGLTAALREADHRLRIVDENFTIAAANRTQESKDETRRVLDLIDDALAAVPAPTPPEE